MAVESGVVRSAHGLDRIGIRNTGNVYWNLTTGAIYEEVVGRHEGWIAHLGPLVVRTGHHTGRSPADKFVVREGELEDEIWWGENNRPFSPERFDALYGRMRAHVQGQDLYVQDCFVGADPRYRVPIRVITGFAWHSLFARNLFILASRDELADHVPEFTVLCVPRFHSEAEIDGTSSNVFIVVSFSRKLVLIGGTAYAGEIKKAIFTVLNYLLPKRGVLSMHCSANQGREGDVALFFGLSGTGKTTLSTDPTRPLIGDDEHGWTDTGVFNFEGGCYAKTIRLSAENEPEIYQTTRRFGTVLENVALDFSTHRINLDSDEITENTRAAYPITHLQNAVHAGMGGHPKNLMFLTADAFGVLPPLARLSHSQATHHFLLGYTARVAGTEHGVNEPEAAFSACFAAPFLPLAPTVYAEMLAEKLRTHQVQAWLVNTGWAGGPAGESDRIKLPYTREMVRAALSGALDDVPFQTDPVFGLQIPTHCPNVAAELLNPRGAWADDARYDREATRLAGLMHEAFAPFADDMPAAVREAGPRAASGTGS